MVVGMNRSLAAEWCARELAAAVGDHFVHIHVELSAAAGHPHMQRKHVVMLTVQNFVASLYDQLVLLIAETLAGDQQYKLIVQTCDEILDGKHHDMFPLHVWMTNLY